MEMQLFSLLTIIFIAYEMQIAASPSLYRNNFSIWAMMFHAMYTIWAIVGLFTIYKTYFIILVSLGLLDFILKKLYVLDEDQITRFDAMVSLVVLIIMFFNMIIAQ
jgi:hypothetical protein